MKVNKELRKFVDTLDIVDRLNAHDSFFGGRNNASKLQYHVQGDEQKKYVDFTSLYPWVNKYWHPDIIKSHFKDLDTYFGIGQVKVNLIIPYYLIGPMGN